MVRVKATANALGTSPFPAPAINTLRAGPTNRPFKSSSPTRIRTGTPSDGCKRWSIDWNQRCECVLGASCVAPLGSDVNIEGRQYTLLRVVCVVTGRQAFVRRGLCVACRVHGFCFSPYSSFLVVLRQNGGHADASPPGERKEHCSLSPATDKGRVTRWSLLQREGMGVRGDTRRPPDYLN